MKNRMRLAKLGRPTAARKALFRNQVAALAEHGRIRTTLPKAKALRHFADRIVTWAKKGTTVCCTAPAVHSAAHARIVRARVSVRVRDGVVVHDGGGGTL